MSTTRGHKHKRATIWGIAVTGVVSVLTLALGWLQLQSAERATGMRLPDTILGGYDHSYVESVGNAMSPAVVERYQSVHYFWDLVFPVAFAALIILLVHLFAGRNPLQLLFYLVPLAYAVVDIAENFTLEAAFSASDAGSSPADVASFLTTAKYVLLAASVLVFVLSFFLNRPATINSKTDDDAAT